MQVIKLELLTRFAIKHPLARKPLQRWLDIAQKSRWSKLVDVQTNFSSAEEVKGYTVFNIHGNDFRLITFIEYRSQKLIIMDVMTHSEYDRWKP